MSVFAENGLNWCDLGGGSGNLAFTIASKYHNARITTCDLNDEALDIGKRKAQSMSKSNVHFAKADLHNLPSEWATKFDYATMIKVFHNLSYASQAAKEAFKILKPGGYLSLLEARADSDPYNTVHNTNGECQVMKGMLIACTIAYQQVCHVKGQRDLGMYLASRCSAG